MDFGGTLDQLKTGVLRAVGSAGNDAINKLTGAENVPTTSNTAPTPDVAAYFARMQQQLQSASGAQIAGISVPLLIALGLGVYLIAKRK